MQVNVYVPNSGAGCRNLDYRVKVRCLLRMCCSLSKTLILLSLSFRSGILHSSGELLQRLGFLQLGPGAELVCLCASFLKRLEEKKPVILAGDVNCAPTELDIHSPATNKKSPGFTPASLPLRCLAQLLKSGSMPAPALHDSRSHLWPCTCRRSARALQSTWEVTLSTSGERSTPHWQATRTGETQDALGSRGATLSALSSSVRCAGTS